MQTATLCPYDVRSDQTGDYVVIRVRFEGYPEYKPPRFIFLYSHDDWFEQLLWYAHKWRSEALSVQFNYLVDDEVNIELDQVSTWVTLTTKSD